LAIVAAGVAYGAWYWYQSRDSSIVEAVPALPDRLAALIRKPMGDGSEVVPVSPSERAKTGESATPAGPAIQPAQAPPGTTREDVIPPSEDNNEAAPPAMSSAVPPPSPTSAENAPPPPPAPASAKTPDAVPAAKDANSKAARMARQQGEAGQAAQAPASSTPPAEPAGGGEEQPPATPELSSLAEGGSRIVLHAEEDCWIQIRDGAGQVIVTRTLHKGDSMPVPPSAGLKLTVGNAGALTLLVDGKPTAALGRVGMVRRGVPLDIDRLNPKPPSE
jgi:cytoskeleton protein RodZ